MHCSLDFEHLHLNKVRMLMTNIFFSFSHAGQVKNLFRTTLYNLWYYIELSRLSRISHTTFDLLFQILIELIKVMNVLMVLQ